MKTVAGDEKLRFYSGLAWIWPIISPWEDYVEETELFSKVIKERAKIEVKSLLHLGCGGGHNDYTFKKHFAVTGTDISEDMLRLARKLNPEVNYYSGDMRSIRQRVSFDAVVILDSINYMRTKKDLRKAFVTAYEHLKPGGVFLTYVEQIAGQFKQNDINCITRTEGNVEIIMIEIYYDPNLRDTSYEVTLIYLIRRKGKLEIYSDRHECGIFKLTTWLDLLQKVGFEVKQMKFEHSTFTRREYHPMLVCVKPLK